MPQNQHFYWLVFVFFVFIPLYVTQATIEHLTGEKLNKLSIIVPPIEQQKVFAEFARKADAANAIIKQEISDLEELMDSKMDEYFG